MDSHAQLEIRQYAKTIGENIIKPLFPIAWEAFEDYRMQSMFLTRLDRGVIERLNAAAAEQKLSPPYTDEQFLAAQDETWKDLKRCRERDECREKLVRLGLMTEPTDA